MKTTTILFLTLSILNTAAWAESRPTLVFAASSTATAVVEAYHRLLQRAYDEIGYDVVLKRYPVKRTYVQADFDKVDGILISSKSLLADYKNLIPVPVPLAQAELVVLSITEDFVVDGPSSLEKYRIGLLRGYLLSEQITRTMQRQIVEDYRALFSILQMKRVDVVIALKRESQRFLATNPEFNDVRTLEPPLTTIPMYHFLNKRHRELISRVSPIVQRLIDEKLLERLYQPYRVD